MNYEDKSKDELIIEFKELQKNYNSLKESIDKHITDQQIAETMFQDIIDKTPMSIQVLDEEGYTIHVNTAFVNIFGVKPPSTYSIFKDDQLLKQGFSEVFDKIKKGEVVQFPIAYFNAHIINHIYPDNPLWLKAVGFTLNDTNGKPEKIIITHENITQTKLAEDKLNESKKMLELVMNSIPQFIFWKDCNFVYLGCNENFALVAGLNSASEIIGKTDYDLPWKKEEADFFVECDRRIITSGIAEYHIIEPQLQANGKRAWLDTNKVPMFDESGLVIGVLGTYEDISERKQAELLLQEKSEEIEAQNVKLAHANNELLIAKEKAEESEEQFRNLFGRAADAIFIAEQESGIIVDANLAAEKLLQLPYNNIIGLNQANLHPSEEEKYNKDTFRQHQQEAKELNITNLLENNVVRADGTEIPVEILASEVFYKGKNCLMGTFRDVTERKKVELELIKAKQQAEESDRLKTAFLQNMSHEIRTPMNAIMGFSDLLVDNHGNKPKLEKFSEIINQRCCDLLEIINDILDIAKIESGQLSINMEECNLNGLFDEITTFFQEQQKRLDKQHIKLSLLALCNPYENIIITDKVKLKQIFINLIGNAFKFTDTGTIEGGCKIENNQLLFFVSDTGIGIPSDKQQLIFERFAQLHQGKVKNIGGTGLGLSIVKGLVNLLGGEIFLESEPGRGSNFSFSLPYKSVQTIHSEPIAVEEPCEYRFANKTILVVEDDYYNAEYLKEILHNTGFDILHAIYGKDAIQIATSQPVDLVLMDIRLPDMDGYEATFQIKQHKTNLKIIAQTAYASHDERQKAIDAGCIDYISKPTKRELLLSIINKHFIG